MAADPTAVSFNCTGHCSFCGVPMKLVKHFGVDVLVSNTMF